MLPWARNWLKKAQINGHLSSQRKVSSRAQGDAPGLGQVNTFINDLERQGRAARVQTLQPRQSCLVSFRADSETCQRGLTQLGNGQHNGRWNSVLTNARPCTWEGLTGPAHTLLGSTLTVTTEQRPVCHCGQLNETSAQCAAAAAATATRSLVACIRNGTVSNMEYYHSNWDSPGHDVPYRSPSWEGGKFGNSGQEPAEKWIHFSVTKGGQDQACLF